MHTLSAALCAILFGCALTQVSAEEITLMPVQDTTIFSGTGETASNGGGPTFSTGKNGDNESRRGWLRFDLSAIPADATIESATLQLTLERSSSGDPNRVISLHRALASWGENQGSNAGTGAGSGKGAPARPGDATWRQRFFGSGLLWTNPGGDFAPTPSASTVVSRQLIAFEWSGPGLLADLRTWKAAPGTNFGWVVIGDESTSMTNRQFHTRETALPGAAPTLQVTYYVQRLRDIFREGLHSYRVLFFGVPGRTYDIEYTPTLNPPDWQLLDTVTANVVGEFDILDTVPAVTESLFYRAVIP